MESLENTCRSTWMVWGRDAGYNITKSRTYISVHELRGEAYSIPFRGAKLLRL